jgi:outer membrane lipoprotein-sorting protein
MKSIKCGSTGNAHSRGTEKSFLKMKFRTVSVMLAIAVSCVAVAANPPQTATGNSGQLESVLASMDKAAANFKTIQCTFAWDQFTAIVNETDTQNGTMYFRRAGRSVEMAAHIEKPETKIVVFSNNGIVRIYQPKIDTEQRYDAGKNREEFETFLVLGFGGRGHDLSKSFDVQYSGSETVGGVNAAKVVLTPKQAKVANIFSQIILWIDPAKGVSVQQKFIQPKSGDYRLAKYSDIQINQKLPDNSFKVPATRKTKIVTPNG